MRHMLLNASQAVDCLQSGQVIAYPTEAVFGLGCDPLNETAVRKVLALKQRPVEAGLILIGSSLSQFDSWVADVPGEQLAAAEQTWPGPVTWLFPKSGKVPEFISGSHDSVAIRVTAHPACIDLCEAFGGPIVSTSANPRTAEPARSAGEVEGYFGDFLGGILEGVLGGNLNPSEIRDVRTGASVRAG